MKTIENDENGKIKNKSYDIENELVIITWTNGTTFLSFNIIEEFYNQIQKIKGKDKNEFRS